VLAGSTNGNLSNTSERLLDVSVWRVPIG